ncbi:unnamed protein product [Ectocarpus sp. CCAP 1310/34]|nr:unnamed protein product [Ectocarpus sp. CCAP 1310/34]
MVGSNIERGSGHQGKNPTGFSKQSGKRRCYRSSRIRFPCSAGRQATPQAKASKREAARCREHALLAG